MGSITVIGNCHFKDPETAKQYIYTRERLGLSNKTMNFILETAATYPDHMTSQELAERSGVSVSHVRSVVFKLLGDFIPKCDVYNYRKEIGLS